jgi:hypothetical protein
MVRSEAAVATTGTDNECRAVGLIVGSGPDIDEGLIFVLLPLGSRCAIWPEADFGGFSLESQGAEKGSEEKKAGVHGRRLILP